MSESAERSRGGRPRTRPEEGVRDQRVTVRLSEAQLHRLDMIADAMRVKSRGAAIDLLIRRAFQAFSPPS